MRNIFKTMTLAILVALLAACSSIEQIKIAEFKSGDCDRLTGIDKTPDWICAPDHLFEQGYVYAIGVAPVSSVQWDYATTDAIGNLALKLNQQSKYESLVKNSFLKNDNSNSNNGTFEVSKSVKAEFDSMSAKKVAIWVDETREQFFLLMRVKESDALTTLKRMNNRDDKLFEYQLEHSAELSSEKNSADL